MQFMLLIIADETRALPPPTELAKLGQAYGAFAQDLIRSGQFRSGVRLHPSSRTKTVRQDGGRTLITDGPCVPGKQHLAGYYQVECADLQEALGLASRVPGVQLGESVEVRPLVPPPNGADPLLTAP